MRNVLAATAIVLAVGTIAAPPSLAEEAADIEAIERELQAENRAIEIVKRARERAERAVMASSIGKEVERLQAEVKNVYAILENTEAHRQYLGSDKMDLTLDEQCPHERRVIVECDDCSAKEWSKKQRADDHARWERRSACVDAHFAEHEARYQRFLDKREELRIDEIVDERDAAYSRMRQLIEKMTDRFIEDEINNAIEQDMNALERELRKMRKTSTDIHDV